MVQTSKYKFFSANTIWGLMSLSLFINISPDPVVAELTDTKKHELILDNQQNSSSVQTRVEAIGMLFDRFKVYSNRVSDAHPTPGIQGNPITGMVVDVKKNDVGYIANHIHSSTPNGPIPDRHIAMENTR